MANRPSLAAQLVTNAPAMQETPVPFLGWEDPWGRDRLPTPVFMGFPGSSDGEESACNAGGLGLIPGLGRSAGEGKGSLQYSGLENSMDCIVHGVSKSWTRLSNFHFQSTVGSPTAQSSEEASWQESPKKIVSESSAF